MFHVEQPKNTSFVEKSSHFIAFVGNNRRIVCNSTKVLYYVVVAPTSSDFFFPTRIYRRNDCGTEIGVCQSHCAIFWISSRSLPPTQSITFPADSFPDAAHSK